MKFVHRVLLGAAALAVGVLPCMAQSQAAAPSVASTMARYRVEQSPAPVRNSALWKAPRKILLLDFGGRMAAQASAFRTAAAGTQLVFVNDTDSAIKAAADADAIIGFNPEICDPRIINDAKQLRWMASLSAGVENCMDLPAIKSRALMMTNMRGIDAPVIAEHAIAMMLALAHGLDRFALETATQQWSRANAAQVRMQFLEGKTLLVSGLGGIGTEVAKRGAGLGMKVIATRDGGSGKPDFVSYVGQPGELLTLARTADVVISAVPLTPQTTGLYDAKFFAVLKPSALFINIARGGSVVTADLTAALNSGKLAGAGLDVVDPEPLPPDNPLWKAPRVLLTPHISSSSDLPGDARWIIASENLRRYVAGDRMLSVVDLQRGY
ncbi:MAG: D-2-hydroxyacid dehydrogenase [Pseudomonadota bacterium]